MNMSEEEKFIFKFANAQLYGIYCDVEVYPIDPEYCWDKRACQWDDANSKDIDEIFEWIWDYNEDCEENLKLLTPFKNLVNESDKWEFIDDLLQYNKNIIPDYVNFYYYIMERRIVGVCFTKNEALRLKETMDKSLNPNISVLSKHDIKGYHELIEIVQYFKNKGREIFERM